MIVKYWVHGKTVKVTAQAILGAAIKNHILIVTAGEVIEIEAVNLLSCRTVKDERRIQVIAKSVALRV